MVNYDVMSQCKETVRGCPSRRENSIPNSNLLDPGPTYHFYQEEYRDIETIVSPVVMFEDFELTTHLRPAQQKHVH